MMTREPMEGNEYWKAYRSSVRFGIYGRQEWEGEITFRKVNGVDYDTMEEARKGVRHWLSNYPGRHEGYVIFRGHLPMEYHGADGELVYFVKAFMHNEDENEEGGRV